MSSNYDALSGGVSAFGGLGRDFGRVGRLGALGTAQASSFAPSPAPAGFHWEFVTYSGERVTYSGEPVVYLVGN